MQTQGAVSSFSSQKSYKVSIKKTSTAVTRAINSFVSLYCVKFQSLMAYKPDSSRKPKAASKTLSNNSKT
jgi:hypothetical protein